MITYSAARELALTIDIHKIKKNDVLIQFKLTQIFEYVQIGQASVILRPRVVIGTFICYSRFFFQQKNNKEGWYAQILSFNLASLKIIEETVQSSK